MMRMVYKYDLPFADVVTISLPHGAQTLHVAIQAGEPRLWVLVDPAAPLEPRHFRVAGTGHPIGSPHLRHISTFLDGGALVFHVFEILLGEP